MSKLVADDPKILWNHVGGTMLEPELEILEQNINNWVAESPKRQQWLLSKWYREFKRDYQLRQAAEFRKIALPDMRDDVPKNDVKHPTTLYEGQNDVDAQTRINTIKKLYMDAIKWNKE